MVASLLRNSATRAEAARTREFCRTVDLLQAFQLGFRGNQLTLKAGGSLHHGFAFNLGIEGLVLAGEAAQLQGGSVQFQLDGLKPPFEKNAFAMG